MLIIIGTYIMVIVIIVTIMTYDDHDWQLQYWDILGPIIVAMLQLIIVAVPLW